MTSLDLSTPGEVRLTLRGKAEDAILTTLRRWPHWLSAEVERDPLDAGQCLAVTLVADRTQEPTLREVLRRSFGLTFPPEGGELAFTPPPTPTAAPRGPFARRGR